MSVAGCIADFRFRTDRIYFLSSVQWLARSASQELQGLFVECAHGLCQCLVVRLEVLVSYVRGVLGLDDLQDPAAVGVSIDLDLDRDAVACHGLAERRLDEIRLVVLGIPRHVPPVLAPSQSFATTPWIWSRGAGSALTCTTAPP